MNTYGEPRTATWDQVRKHYADWIAVGRLDIAPMLPLLDWIKANGLEEELFPFRMIGALGVTTKAEINWDHPRLRIECHHATKTIRFEYWRHENSTDHMAKVVPEAEACETLRQFCALKFGIYRPVGEEPQPRATNYHRT